MLAFGLLADIYMTVAARGHQSIALGNFGLSWFKAYLETGGAPPA